jgi:Protein of unknown function (DUF992)
MRRCLIIAAVMTATTGALAPPAQAEPRIEVGVLRCTVSGGVGLILGSSKPMRCVFRHRGPEEYYRGRITKLGLDIGITRRTEISWAVLSTTANIPPASLAGYFGGVSAEATVGVGVGANALIGGSRRSVILQPLSVQGQTGLNIAAGIAGLRLSASGD